MFDFEGEEHLPKYRLCRVGFTLVSIGLGLLCLSAAADLAYMFTFQPWLAKLLTGEFWKWAVAGPITWTTFLGSYFLWAGWADPRWRRRAGMLLLLNLFDMIQWTLNHHVDLNLPMRVGGVGHEWFRDQFAQGLGWVEFWLFADLAADLATYTGSDQAEGRRARVRTLVGIGAILWAIQFTSLTDWRPPLWPLRHRQIKRVDKPILLLLFLILPVLMIAATLNVIGLAVLACRRCTLALAEAETDRDQGLDLLTSRSETDDFWKDFGSGKDDHWKAPRF